MFIAFSVELHSLIFVASSTVIDASPMCSCPCNPTSSRSQKSMRREISTSSTFDKSSPLLNILKTSATSTTSASAPLSSSVCYCLCNNTSSTSYLLCKYAEWTSQGDFFSSSSSTYTYLTQDAFLSIYTWVVNFLSMSQSIIFQEVRESSFNMTRGGGVKILRGGGSEKF